MIEFGSLLRNETEVRARIEVIQVLIVANFTKLRLDLSIAAERAIVTTAIVVILIPIIATLDGLHDSVATETTIVATRVGIDRVAVIARLAR